MLPLVLAVALTASPERSQLQQVGTFEVTSGKVRVGDPAYEIDDRTYAAGGIVAAAKGTWTAAIVVSDERDLGKRIAELFALHASASAAALTWTDAEFKVGVDSGTAGVFDTAHYRDDAVASGGTHKGASGQAWYEQFVVGMKGDTQLVPGGVLSQSGFGDGLYRCQLARTKKGGEVVGMRLTFIGEGSEGDELRSRVRKIFERPSPFAK
jgi:hypothetical protein